MSSAKITLIGAQQYMLATSNDLFEHFQVPDGIDRDALIDKIMMDNGEFEPIYSDPNFLKDSITNFSIIHQRTFEKWWNALNIEYNPLENYDRMEEWDDSGSQGRISSEVSSHNRTTSTDGESTDIGSVSNMDSGETTGYTSAFDSDSYQKSNKSESTTNSTTTNSATNTSNVTESESDDITNQSSDDVNTSNHRTGRAHGNIGVTTSQQMLESELSIAEWNIYQHISDMFGDELMIMVYI